jgi:hypothetical protein
MFMFGTRTLVRYAGLCALVTGLAACGGGQGSADTAPTSQVTTSIPLTNSGNPAPISPPPTNSGNTATNAPGSGPTISGRPITSINVGSAYAFRPTVSNTNGGALTFSIQNKPVWATFDTTSGEPTGTPGAADAGTYANIIISVSDGQKRASLPAFTLTVQQISNGTVTLDWTAPTENTDGTVLSNLGGYRVRYGTTAGNLTQSVELANAGLTSYVVSNLSSGTWFFGVSAYSTTGVESSLSGVVSQAFL